MDCVSIAPSAFLRTLPRRTRLGASGTCNSSSAGLVESVPEGRRSAACAASQPAQPPLSAIRRANSVIFCTAERDSGHVSAPVALLGAMRSRPPRAARRGSPAPARRRAASFPQESLLEFSRCVPEEITVDWLLPGRRCRRPALPSLPASLHSRRSASRSPRSRRVPPRAASSVRTRLPAFFRTSPCTA